MNLQCVDQSTHKISVYCVGCDSMCGHGYRDDTRIYADLDGPSFKAYYCVDCVRSSENIAHGVASYPTLSQMTWKKLKEKKSEARPSMTPNDADKLKLWLQTLNAQQLAKLWIWIAYEWARR